MKHAFAMTKDSFNITGRGFVMGLKHGEQGLVKNAQLISKASGLIWKIDSRVLFDHAVHQHRLFEVESVNFLRQTFKTKQEKTKSIEDIRGREKQNYFLYLLKPIGHESKPLDGEELEIIQPD